MVAARMSLVYTELQVGGTTGDGRDPVHPQMIRGEAFPRRTLPSSKALVHNASVPPSSMPRAPGVLTSAPPAASSSVHSNVGAGVEYQRSRCGFSMETCAVKRASRRYVGAGHHPKVLPAPTLQGTCASIPKHLRREGGNCINNRCSAYKVCGI